MSYDLEELLQRHKNIHRTVSVPSAEANAFYYRIQKGDLGVLLADLKVSPTEPFGVLSDDAFRNSKYHLIILTAMTAHFCMEGGLDEDTAHKMSNLFIQSIDRAEAVQDLVTIKRDIFNNFTLTMKNLSARSGCSPYTIRAMDYIEKHLKEPMRNQAIADLLGVSADHLSRLFKKETGLNLSQYIAREKCEAARYLLEHSTASSKEISSFLGFASCSHFIVHFKKIMNQTPEEYRRDVLQGKAASGNV